MHELATRLRQGAQMPRLPREEQLALEAFTRVCSAVDRTELEFIAADPRDPGRVVRRALRDETPDRELLVRSPACTNTSWALALFEHHDALCFWTSAHDDADPVLYTYLGAHVWEFSRVFSRHGAVFLRGRGATGPWTERSPVVHCSSRAPRIATEDDRRAGGVCHSGS